MRRPIHSSSPSSQEQVKRPATQRNTGYVAERTMAFPLEREPWLPAPYDNADVAAMKALRDGIADGYQQKLALEWIIYICGTYENPFRSGIDGARASDFASGKQMVGQSIVKLINLPAKNHDQGEQG